MRFRSARHVRWYVAGALLLLVLHFFGALDPIERGARGVLGAPIRGLYSSVQFVRSTASRWSSGGDGVPELSQLVRERDQLATRVALVEAENATLRRTMNYPERNKWVTIGADVVAKTTDIAAQSLLLNRGSRSGVAAGQVVFAEHGALVGTIISVDTERSTVRLLSDRASRIGVLLAKNARPVGIVEGGYGLGVRLSLVPPQEVVEQGDLIVTNDVSEFMPRGLLVGRATNVTREVYEPFQHALVEPAIPFDQIKHVSIIITK